MTRRIPNLANGIKHGYRSGLEQTTAKFLKKRKIPFTYETMTIGYIRSASKYTPDFILEGTNGKQIIIETKGRFVSADRTKHKLVKKQHPELDIRFVFCNSKAKLYKGAKGTYGKWCKAQGFMFADKEIPQEWLDELK